MQRRALCQLWLTCEDEQEAYKIAAALLEARLIVCSKTMPLAADYWWKGAMNHANEVLMVMDSSLELFDEVEVIVKKLHSYDVYVLQAMPLLRMSHDAEQWLMGELKELGQDNSVSTERHRQPPVTGSDVPPSADAARAGGEARPQFRHPAQAPSPARKGTRITIEEQ